MTKATSELDAAPSEGNTTIPEIVVSSQQQRLLVRRDLGTAEAAFAAYPEATKAPALWLYQYMMRRCNGSPALVASILSKIDRNRWANKEQYVYQVTSGKYFKTVKGDKAVQSLLDLVDDLRKHEMLAEQSGRVAFNENLSVWKDIRDYIDRLRARDSICKFGAIEGATGTGKTAATKHYAMLNNHGTTVRFEAPSSPSLSRFMSKLGACYNIGSSFRTGVRLLKIEENINDTRCIIIENVQKLYNPKNGPSQPIFSYLQELQDDTGCTIIMTWTPVFRREITEGRDAKYFDQFVSRIGGIEEVLQVDRRLPKRDILAIADQFEVSDIDRSLPLLTSWSRQPGPLRILYYRLQKARLLAGKRSLTVDHLEAVNTTPVNEFDEGGDE